MDKVKRKLGWFIGDAIALICMIMFVPLIPMFILFDEIHSIHEEE